MTVAAFQWEGDGLNVLDQRLLPHTITNIRCTTPDDVVQVIRSMAVRGAPAIGCVAAYGMVLASLHNLPLQAAALKLKAARPTAVNLAWAVDRMLAFSKQFPSAELLEEAAHIESEDVEINKAIGRHGATLFKSNSVILTHCNTGSLATAGHGTALGVIRDLFREKKLNKVFVDETRPYFQGARLTAWELTQDKIPHELITDNMAAHFMKTEKIDGVIVGCDRVAANGDTANKIGTYGLAVLAHHHQIPFYVAMPSSTLDLKLKSGRDIPIEERSSDEVTVHNGVRLAPSETQARHPAFDVTPAELITSIISEHGVALPPYENSLSRLSALKQDLSVTIS